MHACMYVYMHAASTCLTLSRIHLYIHAYNTKVLDAEMPEEHSTQYQLVTDNGSKDPPVMAGQVLQRYVCRSLFTCCRSLFGSFVVGHLLALLLSIWSNDVPVAAGHVRVVRSTCMRCVCVRVSVSVCLCVPHFQHTCCKTQDTCCQHTCCQHGSCVDIRLGSLSF